MTNNGGTRVSDGLHSTPEYQENTKCRGLDSVSWTNSSVLVTKIRKEGVKKKAARTGGRQWYCGTHFLSSSKYTAVERCRCSPRTRLWCRCHRLATCTMCSAVYCLDLTDCPTSDRRHFFFLCVCVYSVGSTGRWRLAGGRRVYGEAHVEVDVVLRRVLKRRWLSWQVRC